MLAIVLAGCGGASGAGADAGAAGGGCPNDLPASCPAAAPSYAKDIAPLLTRSCAPCHGPGGPAANTPLGDYADLFRLRSAVLDQVFACKMPQPPAVLATTDRVALLGWLVCGAPNN